jgi:hypothetical protein
MSVKNIIITSSINSLPTLSYGQKTYIPSTDYQSFPIVKVIGEYGLNYRFGITQSFSESINTPSGRVTSINSVGYEFIDGQFKGSTFVATDGELSSDNPFLEPNNILSNYVTVLYFDDTVSFGAPGPAITPQSNFLNPNTSPNSGEIYLSIVRRNYNIGGILTPQYRVEYLKIATIDSNGNDNVPSLQGLQDIFIQYSNGNIRQYNITNIVPGPDYYLFKVTTTTAYTSVDSRRLNYNVSASNLLQLNFGPLSSSIITYLNTPTPINPLGYLDINTGVYTLGDTPNIQLDFTASTTVSSTTSATVSGFLYLMEYPSLTPTPIGEQFNSVASPYNVLITGSFTPIEGQSYALVFANFTLGHTASLNFTQFNITQSSIVFPISGNQDLVIFSPYLSQNFFYNDWNALYGNADGLEFDQNFMKVLYDTGQAIPTNQEEILSGSAERAPVKPYNYALKAQTLPRYEGVRTYQQNENKWTEGDIGFGKEPSVKTGITYFIYFSQIYNTYPIVKNKTGFTIKYLIDEEGNVFTPNLNSSDYYNLIDSFETGKKAYASLLNSLATSDINSPQLIKYSGISYKPIIYAISASTANIVDWTNTLDFINLEGMIVPSTPPDYGFYREAALPPLILTPSNPVANIFASGIESGMGYDIQNGWVNSLPNPYYEFNGVPLTSVNIRAEVKPKGSGTGTSTIRLEIWYKRGGTDTLLSTSGDITFGAYYSSVLAQENNFYPQPNDQIYVLARLVGGSSVTLQFANTVNYDTSLKITTNAAQNTSVTAPFWTTGSSVYNNSSASISLTSSVSLGVALQGMYKQQDIPNSGFEPIEFPSLILPGDEIRFEYDEATAYRIVEVLPSSSGTDPLILLTLDRPFPVSPSININHFIIRRPVKDFNLTLDTTPTVTDFGFLFPEYPSDKVNNNLQNIIKNLNEKGLL